jgi:hypothetical protein
MHLGANRYNIVEYFDYLKNKVDRCVELFIAAHYQDCEKEAKINQTRTEWLKEIDECEQFNLSELEKCKDNHLMLKDNELFKKFIFEFELSGEQELFDLRLVAIDTYLSPMKVHCFQTLMKLVDKAIEFSMFNLNLLEKLFLMVEISDLNVNIN